jgi:hypothetical protein
MREGIKDGEKGSFQIRDSIGAKEIAWKIKLRSERWNYSL